ncbi:MAG: ribosome hibernation-promoting factor, HPF/YfiA family [Persicimonas sp.]
MKIPLELAFVNVDSSPAVEQRVRERVDRLERYYKDITSCRVSVEAPHKSQYNTQHYEVHIDITVPGKEIVVSTNPRPEENEHTDIYVAIRDAFDTAERRLKTHAGKQREARRAEARTEPPRGVIARLFPDEGYGFLEAPDGREIYFHANSVINQDFEDLEIGIGVQFAEEMGEKGPQASTVRVT